MALAGVSAWHMDKPEDLTVFITTGDSTCNECGHALGRGAWIRLAGERGALCLSCADLDHLVFLPTGDAALTRRARKHSVLSAVVLKWSRARKRYERQGVLVEEAALALAEVGCLDDADRFAQRVRELFPRCPAGTERVIAQRSYTLSYGANGFVQAIRDPPNRTMRVTYTAANRIETLTDAEGGVTRYTYVGDDEFAEEPLCAQGTDGQRIKTISYPLRLPAYRGARHAGCCPLLGLSMRL